MHHLWALKFSGSVVMVFVFFYAYIWILRNPSVPAVPMPLTLVDEWVGFIPWTIWIYFSLWPYVIVLPSFYANFRQLLVYLNGALLISGVGMAIFYFSPTAVPSARVANRAQHPGFDLLEGVDATGNACPSLHVAFAVYTALGMRRVLREIRAPRGVQGLNLLWGAGICASTLTTGQHVFLDLLAGGALAAVTAVPVFERLHRERS
jgi:membrane-associated phospholipid phosphatase